MDKENTTTTNTTTVEERVTMPSWAKKGLMGLAAVGGSLAIFKSGEAYGAKKALKKAGLDPARINAE